MPPEHEELKRGYDGTTCPFLESAGLGDPDEENENEMKEHDTNDASSFHSTVSSPNTTCPRDQVLGREGEDDGDDNHHQAEKSINDCAYHSSRGSGSSSRNCPMLHGLH